MQSICELVAAGGESAARLAARSARGRAARRRRRAALSRRAHRLCARLCVQGRARAASGGALGRDGLAAAPRMGGISRAGTVGARYWIVRRIEGFLWRRALVAMAGSDPPLRSGGGAGGAHRVGARYRSDSSGAIPLRAAMAGFARLLLSARHPHPGRRAHLSRARQPRHLAAPGPFPIEARRNSHRSRRRASRRLQPDRPALGLPRLRLGLHGARRLRLVAYAHRPRARARRPRAPRPLPRFLGILEDPRRIADCHQRPLGAWPGNALLRYRAHISRRPALLRRGSRNRRRGSLRAPARDRLSRNAHPPIRLRRRREESAPAAQPRRELHRLSGQSRQRHGGRLVEFDLAGRAQPRAALPRPPRR